MVVPNDGNPTNNRKPPSMKSIALILFSLSLAIPLQANEAAGDKKPKKPNPQAVFKKKDKDADGFLTKEEFVGKAKDTTKAEAIFSKKDKNGDSKLSADEFTGKPAGKGGNKKKPKKPKNQKK